MHLWSCSDSSWNADTGASAQMTSHCHWMHNLKPYHVQIRLADGSVVYSEGVVLVMFNPVMNGQEMAPLEFSNVLYVPALCSNLFSVLYLTLHRSFTVCIEKDTMHFIRDLWHHCLCHTHLASIKKLLSGNLVKGFKLDSQACPP